MEWVAAALLWAGNIILIRRKHWVCFLLYMAANVLWVSYWLPRREWAAFLLCLTFLGQNVWGFISWRRQKEEMTNGEHVNREER